MSRRRARFLSTGVALGLALGVRAARAQTLSVSANPVVITAPSEAQYDAASPNNVTSATSVTVTISCPTGGGSNGCNVDFSYTGATLLVDYQVTSVSSKCTTGTSGSFASVPSVSTKLMDVGKGDSCTFTVQVRVRGLSYTAQQAGSTYLQGITLTARRL